MLLHSFKTGPYKTSFMTGQLIIYLSVAALHDLDVIIVGLIIEHKEFKARPTGTLPCKNFQMNYTDHHGIFQQQ